MTATCREATSDLCKGAVSPEVEEEGAAEGAEAAEDGEVNNWQILALMLFGLVIVFGANYLFAVAGEPRSLWLMQVLGVL